MTRCRAALVLVTLWLAVTFGGGRVRALTGDDLAPLMLGGGDLPGFRLAGDGSPPPLAGAVREQRTRIFVPTDAADPLIVLLLSAPLPGAVCLPYLPEAVAAGAVLSALNADRAGFRLLGSLGVGDVDTAATWADFDTGRGAWYSLIESVFMRGQLTVYLTAITYAEPIPSAQLAAWAALADAKLLTADPASPAGALATTPVPPPFAAAAEACAGACCGFMRRPAQPDASGGRGARPRRWRAGG